MASKVKAGNCVHKSQLGKARGNGKTVECRNFLVKMLMNLCCYIGLDTKMLQKLFSSHFQVMILRFITKYILYYLFLVVKCVARAISIRQVLQKFCPRSSGFKMKGGFDNGMEFHQRGRTKFL